MGTMCELCIFVLFFFVIASLFSVALRGISCVSSTILCCFGWCWLYAPFLVVFVLFLVILERVFSVHVLGPLQMRVNKPVSISVPRRSVMSIFSSIAFSFSVASWLIQRRGRIFEFRGLNPKHISPFLFFLLMSHHASKSVEWSELQASFRKNG